MAAPEIGFGVCPLGTSLFGYGVPYTINSTVPKLFLKEDDLSFQANAPAINQKTGDFVRDPVTGIHRGMDSVAQMVYLALKTAKDSTLIPNFGIKKFPKLLTDGIEQEIEQTIQDALSELILRRLIELVLVEVVRVKKTAIQILVRWKNLTNNELNTFRVSL